MSIPQAEGILFGLALGDALGYPVEFLSLKDIKARYGAGGIQAPPDLALYTDDTQMTLALTEGLLEAGLYAPLNARMNAVAARFVAWAHSPENDRAPGITCMHAVARFESTLDWRGAGIVDSKGCGAAMRVATIGYLYQYDDAALAENARNTGMITHKHPASIAATIGAAYLVKLALTGTPLSDYARRVMEFCAGISSEFDAALYRVGHALAWGDEERALAHIGQGWVAEEAVALALYCVLRYPNDYAACVRRAANLTGDSDSAACIAGGIMGARLGMGAIPPDWVARCENAPYLRDLARRMAEAV